MKTRRPQQQPNPAPGPARPAPESAPESVGDFSWSAYLMRLRKQEIDTVSPDESPRIVAMFKDFESVLGPVGAAKSLHMLVPKLFPLWDRAIARAYNVPLHRAGANGERYWQFMQIAWKQSAALKRRTNSGGSLLKAIDEYNYCKYTRRLSFS